MSMLMPEIRMLNKEIVLNNLENDSSQILILDKNTALQNLEYDLKRMTEALQKKIQEIKKKLVSKGVAIPSFQKTKSKNEPSQSSTIEKMSGKETKTIQEDKEKLLKDYDDTYNELQDLNLSFDIVALIKKGVSPNPSQLDNLVKLKQFYLERTKHPEKKKRPQLQKVVLNFENFLNYFDPRKATIANFYQRIQEKRDSAFKKLMKLQSELTALTANHQPSPVYEAHNSPAQRFYLEDKRDKAHEKEVIELQCAIKYYKLDIIENYDCILDIFKDLYYFKNELTNEQWEIVLTINEKICLAYQAESSSKFFNELLNFLEEISSPKKSNSCKP